MSIGPCFYAAVLAAVLLVSRSRFRNRGFTRSYPPLIAALLVAIAGMFLTDLWAYLAFFASLGIALFCAFGDRPGSSSDPSPWEPDLTESDRIAEERALREELEEAKNRRA